MVNKKGILRIVEAGIAVLIVLSVLLVVTTSQRGERATEDLSGVLPGLLDEVAKNSTLRNIIVSQPPGDATAAVISNIEDKISPAFEYSVRICSPEKVCGLSEYPGTDVFAAERIISSSLQTFDPKKLKIFLWRKVQP